MEINYNVFWQGFTQATCVKWGCWCEAPRIGSWILEPVNTWTNLSFIFFGIFILQRALVKKREDHLLINPFFTSVFGLGMIFLGIGSGFFHASRTFLGEWVDILGMYVVSMYFLLFNFIRTRQIDEKTFLSLYLAGLALGGAIIYFLPRFAIVFFGAQLAFTFFHCIYIQRKLNHSVELKYFFVASITFVIAFSAWILDRQRVVCFPYAHMNGHGIWHLLNGFAAYMVYRFFVSDKRQHTQARTVLKKLEENPHLH